MVIKTNMFNNLVRRQVEDLAFKTIFDKTEMDQKEKRFGFTNMIITEYLHSFMLNLWKISS